jgi:acyl carrier protein
MERTSIFQKFKTILSEHVAGNQSTTLENINEQTGLVDDLGIESLDVVNIIIDMEDHFNIQIDNDSIRRMSTVGNCIDLIEEKLQAA